MPPLWFYGLLVLMAHVITINIAKVNPDKDNCLNYESDYHIDRACECIVYQSLGNTDGRFQSPNFPRHYSRGIECILFTFIGDVGEIVEIKFTEFDMMHNSREGCDDYLKLFLYLERPEVNENSKDDVVLCGNMSNLQQKTFYSKSRSLIMEFHTTVPHRDQLRYYKGYSGFRGLFRFKDETGMIIPPDVLIHIPEQYKPDGTKQIGTMCSYDFSASTQSGNFFSLSYPQNYPPNSKCQYTFYGQSHEGTVKVQFQNIQIFDDGRSCRHSADRIAIYDGLNSSAPLIKYLCGVKNQEEVVSTTPYLYIEFQSDIYNQSQGFAANYTFQHKSPSFPTPIDPDGVHTTTTFNCNQDIFSRDRKSGVIRSQNYPSPYPSSTRCTYTFYGNSTQERVQLKFKRVDLFYDGGNAENPFDCDGQDSIKIYIKIDNDEKELANTCGKKIPLMYMSNIAWMKVVFDSGSRTHTNTGFEMEYKFLTNYGITSGKQDDRKQCEFTYYSNDTIRGYFTSPNYPGAYPVFTDCLYKFRGKKQRVIITFVAFDLGNKKDNPRCEPKDKVDYVEFTNYDGGAQDKKMDKFCGQITDRIATPIYSDLAFLQVTFKSNRLFEGNGFNATYQFIEVVDPRPADTVKKTQTGGSNTGTDHRPTNLLCIILTLFTFKFTNSLVL